MELNVIWQELFNFFLSLVTSIAILVVGRRLLAERDRQAVETERARTLFRDLVAEFVAIYNEYYTVRKRYTTVRDTLTGKEVRNPYIKMRPEDKQHKALDKLSCQTIQLEARYFVLMDRLRIAFPSLWQMRLQKLMQRDKQNQPDDCSLEQIFRVIRESVEKNIDITGEVKELLLTRFADVLQALRDHEAAIIEVQKGQW